MAQKGVTFSQTESVQAVGMPSMPPPKPRSQPSSGPVARLLVGARLGFSPRSVFRAFIGIDGEWGPARAQVAPGQDPSVSPSMPSYTVGVSLGATVGTR